MVSLESPTSLLVSVLAKVKATPVGLEVPLAEKTSTSIPLSTQACDEVELMIVFWSPPNTEWLSAITKASSEVITPLALVIVLTSELVYVSQALPQSYEAVPKDWLS